LPLRLAWFDSPEAEAQFRRGISETDALYADLGGPPTAVIDLRSGRETFCTAATGAADIVRDTCS